MDIREASRVLILVLPIFERSKLTASKEALRLVGGALRRLWFPLGDDTTEPRAMEKRVE